MRDGRVQIEGHFDLKRDKHSGGVLNTNTADYDRYMSIQKAKISEKMKIQSMCDDINNIKDEMNDIKYMLKQILEK